MEKRSTGLDESSLIELLSNKSLNLGRLPALHVFIEDLMSWKRKEL